jgi:hypothetical protein
MIYLWSLLLGVAVGLLCLGSIFAVGRLLRSSLADAEARRHV